MVLEGLCCSFRSFSQGFGLVVLINRVGEGAVAATGTARETVVLYVRGVYLPHSNTAPADRRLCTSERRAVSLPRATVATNDRRDELRR